MNGELSNAINGNYYLLKRYTLNTWLRINKVYTCKFIVNEHSIY